MTYKRVFDVLVCLVALPIFALPFVLTIVVLKLQGQGSVIYWSNRVGRYNKIFSMPKFRTMLPTTPAIATEHLSNPESCITPIGRFLRKSSLDELPQLYSIIRGDMSIVGPRPALYNQYDLIELREMHGVHLVRPGLTGLAQINGRDDLSIVEKVNLDRQYCENACFILDMKIIFYTFNAVIFGTGVRH